MNIFDFNLSRNEDESIKPHFCLQNKEELSAIEQKIIHEIVMKSSTKKKPVIIHTKRDFSRIPVVCCAVYLRPMPNAWMPDYIKRLYGEDVFSGEENASSTVTPDIKPLLDEALDLKDKKENRPKRKSIEELLVRLVDDVFPKGLEAQEDRYLFVLRMEGDPISWHDFDLMLHLSEYMDSVKIPGYNGGLVTYIDEHTGDIPPKQEEIAFNREFIRVGYQDRREKTGRVVHPAYLIGSEYRKGKESHVKHFREERSLEFLF